MNEQVLKNIVALETRTRQLLLQYQLVQQKLAQAELTINQREERIKQLQDENCLLKKQYDRLKMAKSIDYADSENRVSKTRINRMLHDVDKCIAILKMEQ